MAGSWGHMVTAKTGRFRGTRLLENLGDCYEALEQCYGMVWWLARELAARDTAGLGVVDRDDILRLIALAQANHKDGLEDGGVARKRIFGE